MMDASSWSALAYAVVGVVVGAVVGRDYGQDEDTPHPAEVGLVAIGAAVAWPLLAGFAVLCLLGRLLTRGSS